MRDDLLKDVITIYTSYVDKQTKQKLYKKKIIHNVCLFTNLTGNTDTTGFKKHQNVKIIIPVSNPDFLGFQPPLQVDENPEKYSAKVGDYIFVGEGDTFTNVDTLKQNGDVFVISESDLKLYGSEPHLYIGGVL